MEGKAVTSTGGKLLRVLAFIIMLLVAVVFLYPFVYIVLGSFKENMELLRGGWNPFPQKWVLSNFVQAWQQANFAAYTKNSALVAISVTAITVICCSMAGYVFERKNFLGKRLLYGTFTAFMFINVGSVALRPMFELAVKTHLNQSLLSVIIFSAGMGQATYIFLIRGFAKSLPVEVEEAAMIDGCGFFGTYLRIALPMLRPVLATVTLLAFRGSWNDYMLPLVFTMSNDKMRTLTVGVTMLKNIGDGAAAWNVMFAGAVMSIIPIIVVYIFCSKYFIDGLTAGAVKG